MRPIAEGNQLVLPFLGMLTEHPRSARDLLGQLGPDSRFEHLRPHSGTIYSLMLTLAEAGWIDYREDAPHDLDRVCSITLGGREELKRRLVEAIINVSWTSGHQFVTALPYVSLFDREEAATLLDQRANRLRERSRDFLVTARDHARSVTEVAKDDYLERRTQFEIRWIEDYRDRVRAMTWPPRVELTDSAPADAIG